MFQKCFGESTLSRTQVFEWHKAFSEGREVVENLPHASRPSTSVNNDNIEKVKKIMLENRPVSIREVVYEYDFETAQQSSSSFSSIAVVWFTMNSFQRVKRPIRNSLFQAST